MNLSNAPQQTDTNLSADLDSQIGALPTASFGQASDKVSDKKPSFRTRIDVNCSHRVLDVEVFFDRCLPAGMAKWQAVVNAIRLYKELLARNPDWARANHNDPAVLLSVLSEKASDNSPSLSLLDSESESKERDQEKEKRVAELSEALAKATKKNLRLNSHKDQIRPYAEAYEAAGILPAHVAITAEQIAPKDWRHKPGRPITLKVMDDLIGEAATWQPEPEKTPESTDANDPNRYLAHEKPALELVEEVEPTPQPRPALTPEITPFKHAYDMWIAELGQLKVSLNRSTYDTWVKGAVLVDIAWPSGGTLTYTCEVPHQYAKDWLDKHLRFNWEKSLSDLNLPRPNGKPDGKTSAPTVRIEILVLGREA